MEKYRGGDKVRYLVLLYVTRGLQQLMELHYTRCLRRIRNIHPEEALAAMATCSRLPKRMEPARRVV